MGTVENQAFGVPIYDGVIFSLHGGHFTTTLAQLSSIYAGYVDCLSPALF